MMLETGFFDLDGTTIDENGRVYDGLSEALDSRHFVKTIITARGYTRFCNITANNPCLAVTPGMPVGLENGARIIDGETYDNIYHHPLSADERSAICDYIATAEDLRYVTFHPRKSRPMMVLWSPDPDEAGCLRQANSHIADVFTSDKGALFKMIKQHSPGMVTCHTYSNEWRDLPEITTSYSSGTTVSFMPQGPTKGTAVQMIAEMKGLDLGSAMAAGNDCNDISMLSLEELGHPVVVGDMSAVMEAYLPDRTVYVHDPRQLGSFILQAIRP